MLESAELVLVRAFEEAQAVRGVRTVAVWFADPSGTRRWLRDASGAGMCPCDGDHPAVRAMTSEHPVSDTLEDELWLGLSIAGAGGMIGVLGVMLQRGIDEDPARFALSAIVARLGRELDSLSNDWALRRMDLALEFSAEATARFLD
jgi:hypothetical protein